MCETLLLGGLGICAGIIIAVGAASLAAAVGIYPRLLAKANGAEHIVFAENVAMMGICLGTFLSVYTVHFSGGGIFLPPFGFFMGIYVGCLLMALAGVLQAFPVMFRRFHIKRGMSFLIFCVALGKLCGSMLFFIGGFGK